LTIFCDHTLITFHILSLVSFFFLFLLFAVAVDMSVYDALVRMAQDFTTYYRLIDGHGNFGSVDADPAAAMRYTECRLTTFAASTLMQDIAEDTVDFLANFDGNEQEPSVLPSKLPLLLLNGSSGIAVGMATNIPPHNLREILTACRAILKQERITTSLTKPVSDDELCNIVQGPDFPTAASIMGRKDAKKLYTTGNGGIAVSSQQGGIVGADRCSC
jgi:DNA gyrase subunit A